MQPPKTLIVMADGTLLGGRDGWIGSSTFMDQHALWQRHEYERIPLRAETGRQLFRHETILTPDWPRAHAYGGNGRSVAPAEVFLFGSDPPGR